MEAAILQRRNRQERILLLAAAYYTAKMMCDDPAARVAKRHILSRRLKPETAFRFQIGKQASKQVIILLTHSKAAM